MTRRGDFVMVSIPYYDRPARRTARRSSFNAGLSQASAVKCENLFAVSRAEIRRTVGHLSDVLKQKLNDCLKAALELP